MDLLKEFFLTGVSGTIAPTPAQTPDPLGPLAQLPGVWRGTGFNQIWRPFFGTQDRFLELNRTTETLQFEAIAGDIPNRGLLQADILLHGITYLQQIQDANVLGANGKPAGIHIEPGIWISVPTTTNPQDPATVARLANIPHGTSILAQGSAFTVPQGPIINPASITPFLIGNPAALHAFPESNLSVATAFRTPPSDLSGITQAMVDNPNSVLSTAIAGQNIVSTTVLRISTTVLNPPTSGGGTSNIAFLQGTAGGPNALSAQVDAIFWIEEVQGPLGRKRLQLQYTQTVLLNFNKLSWPHVSVATLVKDDDSDDDNNN